MMRNPYAKRPRPTPSENSCQPPLTQHPTTTSTNSTTTIVTVAKQQHISQHDNIPSTLLAQNPRLQQQQQHQNANSSATVVGIGGNDAQQRHSAWNFGDEIRKVPTQQHQQQQHISQPHVHDPWDTCDIDWNAASQLLDQATSRLNQNASTTTPTAKMTATTNADQPYTTPIPELLPATTSSHNVNRERPITAIGTRHNTNLLNSPLMDSMSSAKLETATSQAVATPCLTLRTHNPSPAGASIVNYPTEASTNNQRSSSSSGVTTAVNAQAVASLRPDSWTACAIAMDSQTDRPPSSDSRRSEARCQALPAALQYTPEQVQPVHDEYRDALVKNAQLGVPLLNQWTLYPHQRRAILRALLMRRMILALDMGLGKTLIGCVWAKAFKASFERLKIFVICPVSLMKEWKRTAEDATGLDVQDDKASSDSSSLDLQICSWAKVPTQVSKEVEHFVVVCDEAHHIQSMSSARTRDTLQLVRFERCVGVLLLTGTPMKNGKPCNLFPLLRAVGHPFGANQKAFEIHFCAGHQKSFGPSRVVWDANGSSNLGVLREQVASHLLYMTKDQCLEDLPPQRRQFRHVPVSSRFQLQHNQALNELANLYSNSSNFHDSGTAVLGAVQRVRMIASLAKIDATVGLAKEILQNEPAVVIFTSFVKVASSIHQKLYDSGWHGELLTGETPGPKRQGMVDNFQNGLSPVFVCTFGAGGVGLTLTAACTVVLVDRPWTPGDAHQAEDRVRRIGQTKPVTSIWMTAFDLDRQIDSLLEQKNQTSNTVLVEQEDENKDTKHSEAPKISIFQMLKSLLGNRSQQQNGAFTPMKAGYKATT